MSKYGDGDHSLMSGSIEALEVRLAEVKAEITGIIESLDRPTESKALSHEAVEKVQSMDAIQPFLEAHGFLGAVSRYDPNYNKKYDIETALKEKVELIERIATGQLMQATEGGLSKLTDSSSQYSGFRKTLEEGAGGIRRRRATTSAALEKVVRQEEVQAERQLPEALAALTKTSVDQIIPVEGQKNHFLLPNIPDVPRGLLSLKLNKSVSYERPERGSATIEITVNNPTKVVEASKSGKDYTLGI